MDGTQKKSLGKHSLDIGGIGMYNVSSTRFCNNSDHHPDLGEWFGKQQAKWANRRLRSREMGVTNRDTLLRKNFKNKGLNEMVTLGGRIIR